MDLVETGRYIVVVWREDDGWRLKLIDRMTRFSAQARWAKSGRPDWESLAMFVKSKLEEL